MVLTTASGLGVQKPGNCSRICLKRLRSSLFWRSPCRTMTLALSLRATSACSIATCGVTPATHRRQRIFLPMMLQLGSWLWIRKNPRQLFLRHGVFNLFNAHRIKRVRRHRVDLLDFLARVAHAAASWRPDPARRAQLQRLAIAHWRRQRML